MRSNRPTIEDVGRSGVADPLAWFFDQHERHRQLCRLMVRASEAPAFDEDLLVRLIAFVRKELGWHVADEEECLFPLLRRRAGKGDNIEDVLGQLSAEHRLDVGRAASLADHLEACLEQRIAPGLVPACRDSLKAFASQELRHLALENAVVLPIARLRLSPGDLVDLGQRLAARRGLGAGEEPA
jgi:iron-sulfur cluster repair protein YtfE (RIC family)